MTKADGSENTPSVAGSVLGSVRPVSADLATSRGDIAPSRPATLLPRMRGCVVAGPDTIAARHGPSPSGTNGTGSVKWRQAKAGHAAVVSSADTASGLRVARSTIAMKLWVIPAAGVLPLKTEILLIATPFFRRGPLNRNGWPGWDVKSNSLLPARSRSVFSARKPSGRHSSASIPCEDCGAATGAKPMKVAPPSVLNNVTASTALGASEKVGGAANVVFRKVHTQPPPAPWRRKTVAA